MAEAVYGKRIDYSRLAFETDYPEKFVRELLEVHAAKSTEPVPPLPTTDGSTAPVLDFHKRRY